MSEDAEAQQKNVKPLRQPWIDYLIWILDQYNPEKDLFNPYRWTYHTILEAIREKRITDKRMLDSFIDAISSGLPEKSVNTERTREHLDGIKIFLLKEFDKVNS